MNDDYQDLSGLTLRPVKAPLIEADESEQRRKQHAILEAICREYCEKRVLFNACRFSEGECIIDIIIASIDARRLA